MPSLSLFSQDCLLEMELLGLENFLKFLIHFFPIYNLLILIISIVLYMVGSKKMLSLYEICPC